MKKLLLTILISLSISSCVKHDNSKFINARNDFYNNYSEEEIAEHKSILVLPAANESVNIDAPFYFASTIAYPIAEKGYYVFPSNLVNRLLEDEGMSDAYMLNKSSPLKIANRFGADAILYTTIEEWNAKYAGISTVITAKIQYTLKSGKTGKTIWATTQNVKYDSNQNLGQQNSLVGLLISMAMHAAIDKATSDSKHYNLVRSANILAIHSGIHSLPNGQRFRKLEEKAN